MRILGVDPGLRTTGYGVVDTDMEKSLAESVAHEVPGVTRVVDAIGINNQGK